MVAFSGVTQTVKRVVSDFSDKNVTFMAAGIAYNALVSLAPLVILSLLLVSAVGGGLEERLLAVATDSLPGPIADAIVGIAGSQPSLAGVSVVGVVVLLWGTLKIFRGLDTAFSEIYETTVENSLRDQLVDGAVVFAVLVAAIVATVGVTALFSVLSETIPLVGLLTPVVLIAGLVAAFLPMYRRFPDADLEWREALPGAVVGAVGWAVLQGIFQVYLTFKGDGSGGFFGGVIVVVTWLYFSSLVLLLGAVLNSVLGGHSTGQPGGVGASVAQRGTDTELDTAMDRDELSGYLRDLRERLTGRYEELDPSDEPAGAASNGETVGSRASSPRPTGAGPENDDGAALLADEPVTKTGRRRGSDGGVREDREVREIRGTLRTFRPRSLEGDPVEVIERSRVDCDERVHEITITWRTAEPEVEDDTSDRR
ncbi:YihY family inner membrane protein [Halobaculum sp. WSA2]|uniref:YihY family inner membrane protein n=1 Tax=Halobaculum saliterrae TaxID=2073113 RepID=A0A6B0T419_9EURY|nr:YihY/virulence factor BrkB family protein [Halobaculum saliterrae]MXR41249.1 YihY family inner membrane protein [Halobaculum saliterrae]